MERSEAKKLGLSQYTTGRPCRNNHISYRYTVSGSCAKCVNHGRPTKDGYENMTTMTVRVFDKDFDELSKRIHEATEFRYPGITLKKVTMYDRIKSIHNGTAIRFFQVHKDDVKAFTKAAGAMFDASTGGIDMRVIKTRLQSLDVEKLEPLPERMR